jgi:restriction endonuclease S subunit
MTSRPEGWELKRLGDCLEKLKSGKKAERGWSPQCLSHPSPDENVWGVLKTTSVQMGEFQPEYNKELPDTLEAKSGLEVNSGDFLVTTTGPRNRCGIVCHVKKTRKKLIFSGKILRFRVNEKVILPNWLMYLLMSPEYQSTLDKMKVGTSDSSVSIGNQQILDLEILVPPIGEQHKIVELLEDHLSRLDAALVDVRKAKIKATQFRRSLLLSLMSPDYAGSSGDWTRTTLGNVCDLVAGKTPPSLESSIAGIDDSSRTVPFYKVGDMNLHPEYLCESRLYLSAKQVEDRKLFILPKGSVVFPKAGGAIATNKKRMISVPGPIDLNCMAAIPIHGTNPKYLSWWFQSINLSSYADGSILPQLSKGKMTEIPVDWPNPKLQEEIVLSLEKSLSKNSEAIKLAEVVEANSSSLRRSLLQAAFSGQLTNEVVSV